VTIHTLLRFITFSFIASIRVEGILQPDKMITWTAAIEITRCKFYSSPPL